MKLTARSSTSPVLSDSGRLTQLPAKFYGFRGQTHVLMDTEIKDGVLCRVGTTDAKIVKEAQWAYSWMNVEDQVVMDIGANIGAYAVLAERSGCRKLICFEPHPINFSLLCVNSPRSINIQAGVATVDGQTDLWGTPNGRNQGSFSVIKIRGRNVCARRARFLSFTEQLEKYRPSVLKIDCEHAEHEFLLDPLPDHVRQVTIEIHFGRKEWLISADRIVSLFNSWETIKQPVVKEGLWHTLAGWKR